MSNPSKQNKDEVREGTEALQEIADEVEAERSKSGPDLTLPDDDTPEDDGETREDHQDNAGDPLPDAAVPAAAYGRLGAQNGSTRP